jgi:hypothetical protein
VTNQKPAPMKSVLKKNSPQTATNYNASRAFHLEGEKQDGSMKALLMQKAGKSRQEILDLMKILKTF